MNHSAPAVALLFDDTELGGQLRAALLERGARIVHEGGVTSLSRDLLQQVGADVLVVNLDDSADDALDQLYEVIDGDRPRVVFNDAQASRTLAGWDRARWARHLAVKVLAAGDVDPPRPEDAREVDAPAPVPEQSASPALAPMLPPVLVAALPDADESMVMPDDQLDPDFLVLADADEHEHHVAESENLAVELEAMLASGDLPAEDDHQDGLGLPHEDHAEPVVFPDDDFGGFEPAPAVDNFHAHGTAEHDSQPALDDQPDPDFLPHADADQHEHHAVESENLAAELEALLASDELSDDHEDQDGPGLRYVGDVEPPPLHDGNFGAPEPASVVESSQAHAAPEPGFMAAEAVLNVPTAVTMIQTDHLQLSAMTDTDPIIAPHFAVGPDSKEPVASMSAPSGWALLDDDAVAAAPAPAPAPAATEKSASAAFGIEKMSAADFLAPDVESVGSDIEPVMSLELVSLEDAIAPQAYIPDNEMLLDDLGSALSRIVLLGAAANGTESVSAFMAALPAGTRNTILLVQHLGTQATVDTAAQLAEYCAIHCPLPVRVVEQGTVARLGEVLVAPAGNEVRIRRDGAVDLLPIDSGEQSPSIDASFTTAASVFGRNAVAIVFSGSSTDGVAGAQAIHDRGGQVWVESSSGEHFSDMVSGIFAERLVSFSGTPPELAAHLIEVFS